jgi:hypothetical protein
MVTAETRFGLLLGLPLTSTFSMHLTDEKEALSWIKDANLQVLKPYKDTFIGEDSISQD